MYDFFEKLEYGLLELPKADIRVLLYLPYEYGLELKKNRPEALDEHERDPEHLRKAERAYLEIAKRYNYKIINVADVDGNVRSIDDIHNELYAYIKSVIDN